MFWDVGAVALQDTIRWQNLVITEVPQLEMQF